MSIPQGSRRLSGGALILGLGLLLLIGPLAPSASAATPAPLLDTTFSLLLNTLRTTLGLGSLTVDPQLSDIAQAWSTQMANSGVMSHNPALTSQASNWSRLGENVGWGGGVNQIFDALVASPPHMRNMSDPEFTRVGVGTVTDAQGVLWTTHVFMRPKSASAPVVIRPVAPPTTRAPAPVTTRAPRPTSTSTSPSTTATPTTAAPVPTTIAAALISVEASASTPPAVALQPALSSPVLVPARSTRQGLSMAVVAGSALFLLVIGAVAFQLHRVARVRRG